MHFFEIKDRHSIPKNILEKIYQILKETVSGHFPEFEQHTNEDLDEMIENLLTETFSKHTINNCNDQDLIDTDTIAPKFLINDQNHLLCSIFVF